MKKISAVLLGFLLTAGCAGFGSDPSDRPFDLLIVNARIVDGAGNPWFRGDVGIRGDRIAAVGRLEGREAQRTIDARNRILAPGFIDLMGQSSLVLVTDPTSPARAAQRLLRVMKPSGTHP
jgi:N-acyl-D-aspartate/D-glutamate deacylase